MLAVRNKVGRLVFMENNFYRELWFTLRALEHLIGVDRNSLAYRIKRLREFGAIAERSCKKVLFRHQEGERMVARNIRIFDIFAVHALASTYDTVRAQSVVDRCADIIEWNNDADYSNVKSRIID